MTYDSWQLSALAREAVRNVFTPRSRLGALLVLAVLVGVAGPLVMAWESHLLHDQLADLDSRGRNVLVFSAASTKEPVRIGRSSCEQLAAVPGVERAGLLVVPDGANHLPPTADVAQLGDSVPLVHASTTLLTGLRDSTAVAGSALVQPGHGPAAIGTGPTNLLVDGHAVRATRAAPQPPGIDTNSFLALPLPPTTTDGPTCVAVLGPRESVVALQPYLAARLAVQDNAMVGRLGAEQSIDPAQVYLSRTSRLLPLLLGALGALAAGILNRLRSNEYAAYRLSGTTPRSLALVVLTEQGLITGIGLVAAVATLAVVHDDLLSPTAAFCWTVAGLSLWWAGAFLATAPILLRRPSRLAKDR